MDAGTCSVLTLAQLAGGTQCPSLASSNVPAGVGSVDLWIEGSGGAPSQSVTLLTNSAATTGGHTYVNRGYGLFTNGVASGVVGAVYGDIGIEVDGVADQIRFRIEGCLAPVGDAGQIFALSSTLRRQQAGCDACAPVTVDRTYDVTRSSTGVYRFVDSSPAAGCGFRVDLTQFTLN